MTVSVDCKGCSIALTADTEDALVSVLQEHITVVHGGSHAPSREQVLAVIRKRERHDA